MFCHDNDVNFGSFFFYMTCPQQLHDYNLLEVI